MLTKAPLIQRLDGRMSCVFARLGASMAGLWWPGWTLVLGRGCLLHLDVALGFHGRASLMSGQDEPRHWDEAAFCCLGIPWQSLFDVWAGLWWPSRTLALGRGSFVRDAVKARVSSNVIQPYPTISNPQPQALNSTSSKYLKLFRTLFASHGPPKPLTLSDPKPLSPRPSETIITSFSFVLLHGKCCFGVRGVGLRVCGVFGFEVHGLRFGVGG